MKTLAFLDCFSLKTQISVSRNKTYRELCTQAYSRHPVLQNSISAFIENGRYSFFYFLLQLSMFSDDTLCITVKPPKVNPDQDEPPSCVQVPEESRKTFTFYIPNCSQSLWWDLQENTNVLSLYTSFESTRNIVRKNCNEIFSPDAFWKNLREASINILWKQLYLPTEGILQWHDGVPVIKNFLFSKSISKYRLKINIIFQKLLNEVINGALDNK